MFQSKFILLSRLVLEYTNHTHIIHKWSVGSLVLR